VRASVASIVERPEGKIVTRPHPRSLLAAAAATLALLVAPTAATAAPNWTTSSITSAGPYVSGDVVTYTLDIVNTGDAVGGTAGTIEIRQDGQAVEVVGTPAKADGPGAGADMSAQVTVAAASNQVVIGPAFAAGDARVTIQVRLPRRYESGWNVQASGTLGGASLNAYDEDRVVSKGGASRLVIDPLGAYPAVVSKGATHVTSLRITNRGSGVADFSTLGRDWTGAYPSPLDPVPPAFSPVVTFTGGCAELLDMGAACLIGSLAPGQSADVQVTFTGLTHFGEVNVSFNARAADTPEYAYRSVDVDVSNGPRAETALYVTGPATGAGNTDLTYTGALVAHPGSSLAQSRLVFDATGFDAGGRRSSSSASGLPSFRSITLSNGASCTQRIDTTVVPNVTYPNTWHCPFASLAAGQRIGFTAVLNFPTALADQRARLEVGLDSTTSTEGWSDDAATTLNVQRTSTLELGVAGPEVVGAGRVATVRLSVKNTGNAQVRRPWIEASLPGGTASFELDPMPAGCNAFYGGRELGCTAATLEPGATATWTVRVRTPSTAGPFVVHVSPGEWDSALSDAYFGEYFALHRALAIRAVPAAQAPFTGVVPARVPPRTTDQLARIGLATSYTCPAACRATVQLRMNRRLAQRLGLVAPPRRGTQAPPFVVLGTGTAARAAAGRLTVVARLSSTYRARVLRVRAALPLQRLATVVSTAPDTKDARWTATTAVTVRPPRRR
jgi:hypothetical protein